MSWSAWQPGWDFEFTVTPKNHLLATTNMNKAEYNFQAPLGAGDFDTATWLATSRDTIEAGGSTLSTSYLQDFFDALAEKTNYGPAAGSPRIGTSAFTSYGYRGVTLLGSGYQNQLLPTTPPLLTGGSLTYGVDFTEIPTDQYGPYTVNAYADYESSATTFHNWADLALVILLQSIYTSGGAYSPAFTPPPSFPVTFWAHSPISTADPPFVGYPILAGWQGYEAGTVLTHHDIDISDMVAPNTYYQNYSPVTLPMSGITPDTSIVMQSRYLQHGAALPLLDLVMPPGTTPATENHEFAAYPTAFGGYIPSLAAPFDSITPVIRYTSPRWRYWIPAPPAPVEPPALRLNQRNDGMGAYRHARLNTTGGEPNQPSSFQHTRAPRLFYGGNGYQ